ncbi:MAG: hypothetical protein JW741_23250 [Sedimentisphaerales bacterium]|nr:hypothetical protein [Sedimentisphaerales bacterium]
MFSTMATRAGAEGPAAPSGFEAVAGSIRNSRGSTNCTWFARKTRPIILALSFRVLCGSIQNRSRAVVNLMVQAVVELRAIFGLVQFFRGLFVTLGLPVLTASAFLPSFDGLETLDILKALYRLNGIEIIIRHLSIAPISQKE